MTTKYLENLHIDRSLSQYFITNILFAPVLMNLKCPWKTFFEWPLIGWLSKRFLSACLEIFWLLRINQSFFNGNQRQSIIFEQVHKKLFLTFLENHFDKHLIPIQCFPDGVIPWTHSCHIVATSWTHLEKSLLTCKKTLWRDLAFSPFVVCDRR